MVVLVGRGTSGASWRRWRGDSPPHQPFSSLAPVVAQSSRAGHERHIASVSAVGRSGSGKKRACPRWRQAARSSQSSAGSCGCAAIVSFSSDADARGLRSGACGAQSAQGASRANACARQPSVVPVRTPISQMRSTALRARLRSRFARLIASAQGSQTGSPATLCALRPASVPVLPWGNLVVGISHAPPGGIAPPAVIRWSSVHAVGALPQLGRLRVRRRRSVSPDAAQRNYRVGRHRSRQPHH